MKSSASEIGLKMHYFLCRLPFVLTSSCFILSCQQYTMDSNEILLQAIIENRHPLGYIKNLLARPEVSVNFANPRNQQTALHIAARQGDVDLIKLLLSHGAHVNGGTVDLMTPLHEACFGGHPEAVDILISEGAEVHLKRVNFSFSFFLCFQNFGI